MKTRLIIFAVIAALTMVSCTKYYRVLENDTPVYDELDDSAPVLFTLNKGEVVYSQTSVRNWVMVNRADSSGQKGWARGNKLELIEGEEADSLGDLAKKAHRARRQAEKNADQRHKDSVMAAHPHLYYRVATDSIELFNLDMSTKEGRTQGKKVGALEQGRIVRQYLDNKKTTGKWIYVYATDEGVSMSGYGDVSHLERVSQAENDSLRSLAYDNTTGYMFKKFHPVLMWVCQIMVALALVPFVWMCLQQRKRHLWFCTLCFLYLSSFIIILGGSELMQGTHGYVWFYNLVPVAWCTLFMYPLLYTDINRRKMRRIFNLAYLLMVPMCIVLYSHRQDGALWPPFKMYLINVFIYFIFVAREISYKCPYCGKYGGHEDSRVVYEGRFTTTETVKEYHREQTVKTETDYDIYGRKTITNYVRPGYWTSKVKSKTVDVYSHYKRCYNCRHEYIFATEEKEV